MSTFKCLYFITFVFIWCLCVYVCGHACAMVHMWSVEAVVHSFLLSCGFMRVSGSNILSDLAPLLSLTELSSPPSNLLVLGRTDVSVTNFSYTMACPLRDFRFQNHWMMVVECPVPPRLLLMLASKHCESHD